MSEDKNINNDEHKLEIITNDTSALNISEVSDYMNPLRPSVPQKKQVIIPVNKKNLEKKKRTRREIKLNLKKSKND